MKIWARVRKNNKTTEQDVVEIPQKDASEVEDWHEALCELCSKLNLSRPVILDKHVNELLRFSHTVFRPDDFMEQVTFDRLEVELFYRRFIAPRNVENRKCFSIEKTKINECSVITPKRANDP